MAKSANDTNQTNAKRGFAAMSKEERTQIASKGGSASGGKFQKGSERARRAVREGGKH